MAVPIIRFAGVGDIALSHVYNGLLLEKGPNYPFDKVISLFRDKDILFGNLEAPISIRGETYPLKCGLRTRPEYISGIRDAGFSVLSLANNHILDYGEDAFYDTLDTLRRHDIKFFGAGVNLVEARKPEILEVNNLKVGFLGYCDVVIDSPFYATPSSRGIAPMKIEYVKEDVGILKERADIVVVSLHWGIENWTYPSPSQKKTARKIIDYGADLILGHHPHVLQGIEKYRDGVIVYSLGNFMFSDINWTWENNRGDKVTSSVILRRENRSTIIFSAAFTMHGISSFDLVPCLISESLQPIPKRDSVTGIRDMARLSKRICSSNYATFWYFYVFSRKMKSNLVRYSKKIRKIPRLAGRLLKQVLG